MRPYHLLIIVPFVLLVGAGGGPTQDTPDVRPRGDLRGHRGPVKHLAFHPDGKLLASAGTEGKIRLWDIERRRLVRQIYPRERTVDERTLATPAARRIEAIGFSPDGKLLGEVAVESSGEAVLRLWDAETGLLVSELTRTVQDLRALAFAPRKKLVAASMRDPEKWGHKIVIRNRETKEVVAELRDDRMAASHLEFSPDGTRLAAAGARKLHIWDVPGRKLLHTINGHKKAIQSICFSPNGKLLVSGSTDDTVRVWKVETGKMALEIEAEQDGVLAVAFTPSGRGIASAGKDKTIKLWKTDSGKNYRRLWGHLDKVLCLAFSPDAKILASGSADTTIALWPVVEPEEDEDEDDDEDEWEADDD